MRRRFIASRRKPLEGATLGVATSTTPASLPIFLRRNQSVVRYEPHRSDIEILYLPCTLSTAF